MVAGGMDKLFGPFLGGSDNRDLDLDPSYRYDPYDQERGVLNIVNTP